MKTTTVYNYSGTNLIAQGDGCTAILTPGAVYYVEEDGGVDVWPEGHTEYANTVNGGISPIAIVGDSGNLAYQGTFPPSDVDLYYQGFELGLVMAGAVLMLHIVKLIRQTPSSL